jgi:hypothetical protein
MSTEKLDKHLEASNNIQEFGAVASDVVVNGSTEAASPKSDRILDDT